MNVKFLFLVFIGIFISCLGLSKLANVYLGISSDYLTASATFFAAFAAVYLFNDWREQQKYALVEKYQALIKDSGSSLFLNYSKFHLYIRGLRNQITLNSTNVPELAKIEINNPNFDNYVQDFMNTMFNSCTLLHEYQICLKSLNADIEKDQHFKEIEAFKLQLSEVHRSFAEISSIKHMFIDEVLGYAHLTNDLKVTKAIQDYKELCAYSCIYYLNKILTDKK